MERGRPVRAACVALAACALACGSGDESKRATPAPVPEKPSARVAETPPPPPIEMPPPGEARAVRSGERYSVLSNGARLADELDVLAAEARFEIEGNPPDEVTQTELRDVSAIGALRAMLATVPFVAHFEPDPRGTPTLARVTLGAAEAPAPEPSFVEPKAERAAAAREATADDAEEPAEAERRAAVERDWEDPRDSVRLEAIEQMEPDLDRDKLVKLLGEDPSADVRSAAAELLAEGDAFGVTDPLLGALEDRDPTVVLSAVRSLEDVYDAVPDPRIRERIAALRAHSDASVRDAVADFEEWIGP
jgi:hypothetical protein